MRTYWMIVAGILAAVLVAEEVRFRGKIALMEDDLNTAIQSIGVYRKRCKWLEDELASYHDQLE